MALGKQLEIMAKIRRIASREEVEVSSGVKRGVRYDKVASRGRRGGQKGSVDQMIVVLRTGIRRPKLPISRL